MSSSTKPSQNASVDGFKDGRPPGGTARQSSSRTPRKGHVQWSDNPHIHELDEKGLNPDAFENLTDALRRHSISTPNRIHHYPPLENTSLADSPWPGDSEAPSEGPSPRHIASSGASSVSSGAVSPQEHTVPDNYIDPDEREGLPWNKNSDSRAQSRAEKLIGAHILNNPTSDTRTWMRRFKGDPRKKSGRDVEREADSKAAGPSRNGGGHGGILSALFSLHDRQAESPSERRPVRPPLTRSSSKISSGVIEPIGKHVIEPFGKHVVKPIGEHIIDPIGRSIPAVSQSSLLQPGSLATKTKNAGGVIGPLIASTGNLIGPASPPAARLQPSLARTGYRLSMYSHGKPRSPNPTPTVGSPLEIGSSTPRGPGAPEVLSPPFPDSRSPGTPASSTPTSPFRPPGPSRSSSHLNSKLSGIGRSAGSLIGLASRDTSTSDLTAEKDAPRRGATKTRRRRAEIYITRHVALVIQREEFVLKLARALMMFGGPSHRLSAQLQATAHVLDIQMSCMYMPDLVLISFNDGATGTSNVRFIKQTSSLNLEKLAKGYLVYWKVIHDEVSVAEASEQLDTLMTQRPVYSWWQLILIGGMCSAAICTVSFSGSFIDALVAFPLGGILVGIQILGSSHQLYSNIFEVTVAMLFSFLAAVFASTQYLCYSAVASSSVVLILPGFIVLCGALELMSRNLIAGSVRLGYAIMYSLFLGFGLAVGAEAYEKITKHKVIGGEDYTCSLAHPMGSPWYRRTPSKLWAFLTVPLYSLCLSMRNQTALLRWDMLILVAIACVGWVTNHFTGVAFPDQQDIIAGVGAFAVGVVSNVFARFFHGNAFVIMITGILFQLPSGLGSGGLLTYASQQAAGSSTSYLSGFQTALKLVSVGIGLTVGLGISLVVTYPIQSKKRAGGVFSL